MGFKVKFHSCFLFENIPFSKTSIEERLTLLILQAPSERNYHIFYQLCAAKEMPELSNLALKDASEVKYVT